MQKARTTKLFKAIASILWVSMIITMAGCGNNSLPPSNIDDGSLPVTDDILPPETDPIEETTEPVVEETIPEPEKYLIDDSKKYIGVYADAPQDVDVFEDSIDMLGWFDTFDKISVNKISICLDEHKYVAFITLEPAGMTFQGIVNGDYDEKIINYLNMLSDGDRIYTELFVRFAHEMEMRPGYTAWYTWQTYNPEGYVAAWQHIVSLGREYAPNVKWVWSPNRADTYTTAYYPGDEYVDYVSLTLNNTRTAYKTFGSFYEELGKMEYLETYNKPIIMGEIAEHCYDDNQKAEYIASVFDYLKESNIIGVVFLNKDIEYQRQYQFSDNEFQLQTFIEKAKELRKYE